MSSFIVARPGPEGLNFFSMLKSAEHEIYPAHECKNANNCLHFKHLLAQ